MNNARENIRVRLGLKKSQSVGWTPYQGGRPMAEGGGDGECKGEAD